MSRIALPAPRRASGTLHTATATKLLKAWCVQEGLPEPVQEYRFHSVRRWRFDHCWPAKRLAVEVEGGIWTNGRHSRGKGFMSDCEKYSRAALDGWCVLRTTPRGLLSTMTLDWIREGLCKPR